MAEPYFEIKIVPRFDEVDLYGIVHHKNYFSYFEEARFRLAESLGLLKRIFDENLKILVIECGCSYKIPARLGDKFIIRVFAETQGGVLNFRYSIIRESDHEEIASGFTNHVFLKGSTLLAKIPEEFRKKLEVFYQKK